MTLNQVDRIERGIEYLESVVTIKSAEDWKGKQLVEDLKLEERISSAKARLAKVTRHWPLGTIPSAPSPLPLIWLIKVTKTLDQNHVDPTFKTLNPKPYIPQRR